MKEWRNVEAWYRLIVGLCEAQMETALRAETQTRLCECERRKTSNCLSRRRVFDVQRTSTPSGSARYVQP